MSTRVTIDGVPNEAVAFSEFLKVIAPVLDLLGGIDAKDVVSLHIGPREVRAKVVMRTKRGHLVHGSWAHVARRVDFPVEEEA